MVSIDELIEEKHNLIMSENRLEVEINIDDALAKEFMDSVRSEAKQLRTHGKTNYYLKVTAVFNNGFRIMGNIIKRTVIRTDAFLRRFGSYQKIIKPVLKKIYLYIRPQKKVCINHLYKLNDEDFIKELYHLFLNRNADEDGYMHNLKKLQNRECDRLDMIYSFNDSHEGGRIPVKITGMFIPRKKKESNNK